MTTTTKGNVSDTLQTNRSVATSYARYLQTSNPDTYQSVGGSLILPSVSFVNALIGASINLYKGATNLKNRRQEQSKEVSINIKNCTNNLICFSKIDCATNAYFQDTILPPGKSIDLSLGNAVGNKHGTNTPRLYFYYGNDEVTKFGIIHFADNTDDKSRQINLYKSEIDHISVSDPDSTREYHHLSSQFYLFDFKGSLPNLYIFMPPLSNSNSCHGSVVFLETNDTVNG